MDSCATIFLNTKDWKDFIMRNPYKPGAGTSPEYLAGRDKLLNDAKDILLDLLDGGMATHTVYYGVRGVGKTVLLSKVEELAASLDYLYTHIECDENFDFIKAININCKQFLKQLSKLEVVKELIGKAKAVFMSFKGTYAPEDNNISFEINPDLLEKYGNANTGDLVTDLIILFQTLGELAQKADTGICFFIDEIQSIKKADFIALITALHRMNQLGLPILLFGAGLPTIQRISGEAKSYSERLFDFVKITSLKENDAIKALIEPAKAYGVTYSDKAIDYILRCTGCYPYFIQQFGKIIWKLAKNGHAITIDNAETVYEEYIEKLDDSFFSVRYNRSTKAEKGVLFAMATFDKFPCSMQDLSVKMGKKQKTISPLRNNLINKGLLYAPSFGEIDFTVPQFDSYLRRMQSKEQKQVTI